MEHTVELYGLDISRLLQSFINGKCAGLESSAPSCRSPHSSTKIVSVDESLNGEYTPSVAEKDIFEVYKLLTWCPENPIVREKNIIGRSSAEMSCHGKGFPSGSFPPTR